MVGGADAIPAADPFIGVSAVADSVLYEGYLLYPYRRSSQKNRVRWQFGVLAPRRWVDAHGVPDPGVAGSAESWFQQVECLAEAAPDATLRLRLRFLHARRRQLFRDGAAVDTLDDDGQLRYSFDDAEPREVDVALRVGDLLGAGREVPVTIEGDERVEPVGAAGSVRCTAQALTARLQVSAEPAPAPFPLLRLRIRVENAGTDGGAAMSRDDALRRSLLATHVLLAVSPGRFVSLLDPPHWAAAAAAGCHSLHVFPVLGGRDDVLLCSPIIMYDHPQIAPESPGDLHDATEIDEILSLRTLTLTDAEKAEARATDPRAARIVDRVDAMPPELFARLHGALRTLGPAGAPPTAGEPSGPRADEVPWWDPRAEAAVDPATDSVLVAGVVVSRGSRVRLRPRGRGDAHDMFLAGRTATVHAVLRDVDGSTRVAVTVEDDPAAELAGWHGRYFHFQPDELDPLG